jgi:hypothetical protein
MLFSYITACYLNFLIEKSALQVKIMELQTLRLHNSFSNGVADEMKIGIGLIY